MKNGLLMEKKLIMNASMFHVDKKYLRSMLTTHEVVNKHMNSNKKVYAW